MEPIAPGEPGDIGEPERLDIGAEPPIRSRARATVLAAVAGGAVLLVAVTALSGLLTPSASAPESDPVPTPTRTPTPISWPTPRQPTPTPSRPAVFSSSGFLSDLDVDVFVRSTRAVFRIETQAGRVTRTAVPGLESSGPVWFLAAHDRVLVRPMDAVPGQAVVDGTGARPLTGLLASVGNYLPGPDGRIWVVAIDGDQSSARLTDAAGSRVWETVRAPGTGGFSADGAGGLFFAAATGGTYQATSAGLRRVTRGAVLATSRDRYLSLECDDRFACEHVLHDRRTGGRERVGRASGAQQSTGVLSADGRYAALVSWRENAGPTLEVIELAGGQQLLSVELDEAEWGGEMPAAWLPDGRLLGLRDTRLFVFDPRSGQTTRSSIRLPPLRQLALRLPAG